jgi:hypothetical protein
VMAYGAVYGTVEKPVNLASRGVPLTS